MALKKKIQKPNGLTLEYHRIAMVKIDTNLQCTILVDSYLNQESRLYEKNLIKNGLGKNDTFPYVNSEYISFEYDESMNIKNAYEWLKNRPGYEGSEDVFEKEDSN